MATFFRSAVFACAWLSFPGISPAADEATPKGRMNVLFVVYDDLCCEIGSYGSNDIQTPNIDRFAARGVRFERAYCQYPVCNPSRASFLSSKRPDTIGIFDNARALRKAHPDFVTLPQLFKENGYYTAGIGKVFHRGVNAEGKVVDGDDPTSFHFFREGIATPIGNKGDGRDLSGGKLFWCRWLAANGADDDQPDGQIADEAIRQIEQHKDGPFFVAAGFHKPHDPFNAPSKYFDLYPLDKIRLPHDPGDRTPDLPLAIPAGATRDVFAAFTDQDRRELKRAYSAGASFTDAQLGKLLDTLDRLKLWDHTVVVVMSDHGYHLGEHGWWNKVTLFELCARVPLIVWAPGAKGMGNTANGIVEFVDIYPTLAELCGLKPPENLAGVSFRPLLDDPAKAGKSAAFTQVTRDNATGRTVRSDRWRYTEWDAGEKGVELYDHTKDPLEYHNLAGRTEFAADEAAMKQVLHRGAERK